MRHPATLAVRIAVVTIGLATTWSCVSDKVVYRDAASFTQPAAAAASFVGYSRTADKQTTCGNCHVDQQTTWSQTAHSKAWADLQASGHSTSACEACHSVSKLGNGTSKDSVGYVSTKDPRYQDV
jgi:cytochrome c peroxidase